MSEEITEMLRRTRVLLNSAECDSDDVYIVNSDNPCTYPDCRCPIDLPHKDSPCAIGRKKESGNG